MSLRQNREVATSLPFRNSIVTKIGVVFGLFALIYSVFLVTTVYMTSQLIGVSTAVDEAGAQRMRVYRIGLLITSAGRTEQDRQAVRDERDRWVAVWNGLRSGTESHGPVAEMAPAAGLRMQDVDRTWTTQLGPTIDRLLDSKEPPRPELLQRYLREADAFVSSISEMVGALEQDAAARIRRLYWVQIGFLTLSVLIMSGALLLLHQQIRVPLGRLAQLVNRLLIGDEVAGTSPSGRRNELSTFAQTLEGLVERFLHDRDEIRALHATGQEIASLGALTLEEILQRIVNRAADLVSADQAALFLQHPFMECWIVEAASGKAFDRIRKEILLFEQTPFVTEVFESRRPVTIDDLSLYPDRPVRLRDEFQAKSFLGVPLLTPHGCIGVLALMSTQALRHFPESDIHLAQQFASYAAVTIENARLFEAVESESKLLKDKLAAVERKVAELTHEVKAPAGRVAEFASWIEQDYGSRLDEKGLRYLRWIQKEGRDLASLANRTLDWTRLTQVPASVESVDVRAVLSEVIELLEQDRARKGIRIDIAPDLPRAACQRIHVKQIFENLLSNAIKYTGGQPNPAVQIGWRDYDAGPCFFVRDNGKGIDPTQIDRIFLPFQRLATEEAGAGIGLSIVKTVLEHYGGKIWVESQPGQGATFYFTLPILAGKPTDGAGEAKCESIPQHDRSVNLGP
jgi:signal transduction histidine kinase